MTPESDRPRRRAILIGGVILAVVFSVVVGRWRSSSGTAEPASTEREATESAAPNAITIDERTRDTIGLTVQAVEQRPFAEVIQATGIVTPNETRVAHVR